MLFMEIKTYKSKNRSITKKDIEFLKAMEDGDFSSIVECFMDNWFKPEGETKKDEKNNNSKIQALMKENEELKNCCHRQIEEIVRLREFVKEESALKTRIKEYQEKLQRYTKEIAKLKETIKQQEDKAEFLEIENKNLVQSKIEAVSMYNKIKKEYNDLQHSYQEIDSDIVEKCGALYSRLIKRMSTK